MKLTPETVYVRSFNKNAEYEIWVSNSREHELEYPADAKLNHYCLSKEELIRLVNHIWGSSQDSCHGPSLPEFGSKEELIDELLKTTL